MYLHLDRFVIARMNSNSTQAYAPYILMIFQLRYMRELDNELFLACNIYICACVCVRVYRYKHRY